MSAWARWTLFLLGIAAVLGLATPASHAGRWPRYGGTLRVALGTLPASLDPLKLGSDDGALVAGCLYEGLTRWDSSGVGPALARSWNHDEEGQRWRFKLRSNASFHDGSRCDATAVARALERLADPRQSPHAWLLADLAGWPDFAAGRTARLDGIDVIGATEIELRFEVHASDVPARLALPVAGIARRQGGKWLGTGAFEVARAEPGLLQLAASRDHAGGRPYLDRVEFVAAPDTAAREPWGAVRCERVRPGDGGLAGAVRVRSAATRLGFLLVNSQSEILGDEASRRLLSQSFDRSVFVRVGLGGDGESTEDLLPGELRRVDSRTEGAAMELPGPAGARARIVVSDGEPVLQALGERLQVHLYALGVAADLAVRSGAELGRDIAAGRFDVAVLGWTPPQPADEALLPHARVQCFATTILQPALGGAFPEAWAPARLAGTREPAATLLKTRLCIPLVFFHDLWQAPVEILHLEPGLAGPGLALDGAHLEPHAR